MAPQSHALDLQIPKHRDLLGGDLLAQSLHALGVRVLFGLHGGHLDAFLMGCADMNMRLVDTRHETVAVQAAEGWAKVNVQAEGEEKGGGVGVFCNGIPGLATAFADRSPILCITSSPPLRDAETNALQGFHDQVVLAKPMTKFAHRITNPEEIPRITSLAYRTANSGTPGPVLLDFPIDILFTPVDDINRISWGNIAAPLASRPGPDPRAIRELAGLLSKAERPVIIVGTGAKDVSSSTFMVWYFSDGESYANPDGLWYQAVKQVSNLSTTLNVPIFHSPKFSTTFPSSHALHGGSAALLALLPLLGHQQPDLVVLLGARTGFILGGRSGAIIPNSNCTVAQIDIDGAEIGRSTFVDLGIVSDVSLAVDALNTLLLSNNTSNASPTVSNSWNKTLLALKDFRSPANEAEAKINPDDGAMHPYHALSALFPLLPQNHILSLDGGECAGWSLQCLYLARHSLSLVPTGYLGFLGNGWGYSLGAAIAAPDTWVVNIQGDGSAGFHLAELDTFVRMGVRVLTVVVNNSAWGMSLSGQDLVYGEKTATRAISRLNPETRYHEVAGGFGMQAYCISAADPAVKKGNVEETFAATIEALRVAVKSIVDSGKSGFIDLRVSAKPVHDGTKAMVGDTKEEGMIVVPYYDNLPRPRYDK
ncbi:hypothetical protein NX059_004398 [Plenodomus lindquistii]|nr:hypothetical protein NX059_004398 [Plenodomus lindquistii]